MVTLLLRYYYDGYATAWLPTWLLGYYDGYATLLLTMVTLLLCYYYATTALPCYELFDTKRSIETICA